MIKLLKLKYFYIILFIVWVPFQKFILKVDGAGISLLLISFILFVKESNSTNFLALFKQKPFWIWGVWIIYNFVNTLSKGSSHQSTWAFFLQLFYPLFIILILYHSLSKFNIRSLFTVLIIGLYLYIFLVFIFDVNLLLGLRNQSELNSNVVGINAFLLVFVLVLKYIYKHIKLLPLFLLSAIPVVVLIVTASRKSFIALLIILVALLFTRMKGSYIKRALIIVFSTAFLYIGLNFISENTILGERFLETTNATDKYEILETGTVLDKFGDRGIFYYYGWDMFLKHPLTGVGLQNFKRESKLFNSNIHSEYMVHLAEGGILGTILFFIFYYWIGKQLIHVYTKFRNIRGTTMIYIAGFIAVLFINTAAWTYDNTTIFILLGLIIGYVKSLKF